MNCFAIFQGIVTAAQLFNCHRIQKTETLRGAMKIGRTHEANSCAVFVSFRTNGILSKKGELQTGHQTGK
jgi:hypothetical protein